LQKQGRLAGGKLQLNETGEIPFRMPEPRRASHDAVRRFLNAMRNS